MTRRERMERRLQKRLDWAQSRDQKANQSFAKVDEIAKMIPPGQPVLVGHHSEKRHRRDLARMESGMVKGFENKKMAEEHRGKALGIEATLERAIFSDDENAVEALEEKIRSLEAERERNNELNKAIKRERKSGEGWIDRIGATEEEKKDIRYGGGRIQPYVNTNLGGRIRQAKERIAQINRMAARKAEAEANGGVKIGNDEHGYCWVTFAEYPGRKIVDELKAAGFFWRSGTWQGRTENLPATLREPGAGAPDWIGQAAGLPVEASRG